MYAAIKALLCAEFDKTVEQLQLSPGRGTRLCLSVEVKPKFVGSTRLEGVHGLRRMFHDQVLQSDEAEYLVVVRILKLEDGPEEILYQHKYVMKGMEVALATLRAVNTSNDYV